MRTRTIRIFVVLALISVIGITVTQAFWFKKAFDTNEQEFTMNTTIALKEVVKDILKYNHTNNIPADPVKQLDHNSFVVVVDDKINKEVLEYYLFTELKKFNINQSFEYSIYDCTNQKMVFGRYVEGLNNSTPVEDKNPPLWCNSNYYFTVYFPHKTAGVFGQMGIWWYSSAVVLVVVVFFGYSLFVILKQKKLSEIQRDFINNMTHEIRTPISTIAISAQTIRDPEIVKNPGRLVHYASVIQDEASKLKAQVERVLSVAGPARKMKLYFEPFDLHELIRNTSEQVVGNADKKVKLELDLKAGRSVIHADKLQISNLISNLVDNSIKYSGEEVNIKISSAENQANSIEVQFSDNGIGISREHQKKIFDKFYRVPKGNIHDVKGFGIGLNFVMLVTRLHHGSIRVSSELHKGTVFKLTLPLS